MNKLDFLETSEYFTEVEEKSCDLNNKAEIPHASINPHVIAYGATRIAAMPETGEAITEVKELLAEKLSDVKDVVVNFGDKVRDGISDFCQGAYERVADYFTASRDTGNSEFARLGTEFSESRNFGISECSDAAIKIFTTEVVDNWGVMSKSQRIDIARAYAAEVAKAFELVNYTSVIIERLEPGTLGYNNGDGSIHLSDMLIEAWTTPFEIMDTITHELRHQYQNECIRGYHDVSDEVRKEWAVASAIYNYDQPSCYDPWGYTYNPLELDSRYAGETVVRNVTSNFINNINVA